MSGADGPAPAGVVQARRAWHQLGVRLQSVTPRALVRFLLVVGALAVVFWLLVSAWSVLTPFILGAAIAYVLLPLMNLLDHWLPRWASIVIVLVAFLVVVLLAVVFIVPPLINQLVSLVQSIPDAKELRKLVQQLDTQITALPPQAQQAINDAVEQGQKALKANLGDVAKGAASFFFNLVFSVINTLLFLLGFFIVPFWLFYVLKDEGKGRSAFARLLPPWMRADVLGVLRTIDRVLSSWLRGQIILSAFLGVSVFAGLTLLELLGVKGIQYKLLVSLFICVTSPIPFVGSFLSAIPPVLMALVGGGLGSALAVVALYVVMQTVQDNVLSPKIMGESLNIHPAIVMPLVVILGRNGILWIILAGPAAALARDLFLYVYGRFEDPPRPAGLLPGEPLPLPETPAQAEVVPVERSEPGPAPPGAPPESSEAPASSSQPRA
jgi:predicted PurR-regulated permease PerM